MHTETITWQSVTAGLPDADMCVLIACDTNLHAEPVWIGFHDGEGWREANCEPAFVTHWAQLPAAPAGAAVLQPTLDGVEVVEEADNQLFGDMMILQVLADSDHVNEQEREVLTRWMAASDRPSVRTSGVRDITAALSSPGVERLRDFYSVGPVQRAAVESFVDALGVAACQICKGAGCFTCGEEHRAGVKAARPPAVLTTDIDGLQRQIIDGVKEGPK